MDSARARRRDRGSCARLQQRVLADQRAVEIAPDRFDGARKISWELQPCGLLRKSTRALRSDAGSDSYDFGMTFFG